MRNIGIFCASSNDLDSIYFEEAARLGAYIGQQKKTLVYGGNAKGLMEAMLITINSNRDNNINL